MESLPLLPKKLVTINIDGDLWVLLQSLMRAVFAVVAILCALAARVLHVLVVMVCADPVGCLLLGGLMQFGQ